MGPTPPPQYRDKLLLYNENKLWELQLKFKELKHIDEFSCPKDIRVAVKYVNPSFLVKSLIVNMAWLLHFPKYANLSHVMPNIDSGAFYQIPLAKETIKYCGVVISFRGIHVYTGCIVGITALEGLMCWILGDLLVERYVAKLADDLYCVKSAPSCEFMSGAMFGTSLDPLTSFIQAVPHVKKSQVSSQTLDGHRRTWYRGLVLQGHFTKIDPIFC